MGDMINILCGGLLLTLMKAWLILCQQVLEVHEEGYRDLMEKVGTYSAFCELIDGGKWYLVCIVCDVGSFVGGFIELEVV